MDFKRKKGESFENFMRRFNRRLISSGKLYEVRQRQFHHQKKNKIQQKEYALISLRMRAKKEWLRKTSKLKEEPKRKW